MTEKFKFILVLIIAVIIFIALQLYLYFLYKNDTRKNLSLLNQYYLLKSSNHLAAKRALEIILEKDPHNRTALHELAYWYLNTGNTNEAMKYFTIAYQDDPNNAQIALELAKLYIMIDKGNDALSFLKIAAQSHQEQIAVQAQQIIAQITSPSFVNASAGAILTKMSRQMNIATIAGQPNHPAMAPTANAAKTAPANNRDALLNKFYDLKNKQSPDAWQVITAAAKQYPSDIQILKEAGYYALMVLNNKNEAAIYFYQVYCLNHDPKIALQLAYIYDGLDQKKAAYHYFDLAANTTDDPHDRIAAEIAKSNLAGAMTKILPYPYYASLDYSPLYMSRFKLLIHPIIFHLGLILNKEYNWRLYLSYRRTSDDQSGVSNLISNIFEDNTAITAIGMQLTPLKILPQLIMFAEWGKSIDLIYRQRSRWRTDFRGGMAFYNDWGKKIDYTLKPTFLFKPNADVYGDAIYYNRYHDGIATLRARPGAKVFRLGRMSIDLYYRLFIAEDQARQFYNNIFENGPGVALKFSDSYNIVLRYEQIHGRYLPANSPSANPYSKNYHNAVTELDTYFEF